MKQFKILTIFYIAFLFILFPKPAHAYLDPGTGSYLFQVLIAGFVGGAVVLKGFWSQIKSFFLELFSRKKTIGKKDKE